MYTLRLSLLAAICLPLVSCVSALNIVYCSGENTAEGSGNTTRFMSNGVCYQQCVNNFAFAINQDNVCWCSDYVPGSSVDISECNTPCPGYQMDNCGGPNLFAYQALPMEPSGTKGTSSSSSVPSTTASMSETSDPVTVVRTITAKQSTTSSSPPPTSSTTSSSSSDSTTTWTPTPVVSLETITGQVRTVTVTPTVPPNSQSMDVVSKSKTGGGGGLGTGGTVGLVVGLLGAAAIVATAIFFCLRRRKRRHSSIIANDQDSLDRTGSAGLGGPPPMRTLSEHSRFVLGTDGRNVVEAWEPDNVPTSPTRRNSRLVPIDQRLDPYQALYMHQGRSGESVNSIQDNRDYSRRVQPNMPILRMTNPDTEAVDQG